MKRETNNKDDVTARIGGISRLRIESDGPGIRTLVALSGCRLDCAYCINRHLRLDAVGTLTEPEELLEQVKIDDIYFQFSGGGITFGGGEPLLKADYILRFRQICPPEWTIAVETSLNVPEEVVELLVGIVDYWIVDIKEMDPGRYLEYTGTTNEQVLANLKTLREQCASSRVRVRVPRIPGLNKQEDVDRSVSEIRAMGFAAETFSYDIPDNFKKQFMDRDLLPGSLIAPGEEVAESDRERSEIRHGFLKGVFTIFTSPLVGVMDTDDENWTD